MHAGEILNSSFTAFRRFPSLAGMFASRHGLVRLAALCLCLRVAAGQSGCACFATISSSTGVSDQPMRGLLRSGKISTVQRAATNRGNMHYRSKLWCVHLGCFDKLIRLLPHIRPGSDAEAGRRYTVARWLLTMHSPARLAVATMALLRERVQ